MLSVDRRCGSSDRRLSLVACPLQAASILDLPTSPPAPAGRPRCSGLPLHRGRPQRGLTWRSPSSWSRSRRSIRSRSEKPNCAWSRSRTATRRTQAIAVARSPIGRRASPSAAPRISSLRARSTATWSRTMGRPAATPDVSHSSPRTRGRGGGRSECLLELDSHAHAFPASGSGRARYIRSGRSRRALRSVAMDLSGRRRARRSSRNTRSASTAAAARPRLSTTIRPTAVTR